MSVPPTDGPPDSNPPPRRIRVRLSQRNPSDPKGDIDFAQWCIQNGIRLDDGRAPQPEPETPSEAPPAKPIPDEQLETVAAAAVGQELDEINAPLDEAQAKSEYPSDRQPEPPSRVIVIIRDCGSWMTNFVVATYTVTVKQVAKGVTEAIMDKADKS